MSTHDRAARIGRERTREVLQALHAVKEWQLPSRSWEQVDALLGALAVAVHTVDLDTVDEVTADLEACGRRVTRAGAGGSDASGDRKVAPPAPLRERVVLLIHAVEADPAAGTGAAGPGNPGDAGSGEG